MRQIILDFSKQFNIGLEAASSVKASGKFKRVIVCGMGGSALPGEILKAWVSQSKINFPILVSKEYNLPLSATKESLICVISYSGNTAEPLSAYLEAQRKHLPVVAIASGGELLELCSQNKTPLAVVPEGIPSRSAVGYQTAALFQILINSKIIPNCTDDVRLLSRELKSKGLEKQGKGIAKKIKNKTPIIYSSLSNKALAYVWKVNFNESSKIPAFYNYFPEANHNELSGFENTRNFYVLILKDPKEDPRIISRMKLTQEIIKKEGVESEIIKLSGKNVFSKLFRGVLLGLWASYYLALERKVDPSAVRLQDELKNRLKNHK